MKNQSIVVVVGTRPEAIKLAPVIQELEKVSQFLVTVMTSGQHATVVDEILSAFGIRANIALTAQGRFSTMASSVGALIEAFDQKFLELRPQMVIVQGDTNTVFAAAYAAFLNKIPVSHIEAGLRSGVKYSPFPEELNRSLTGRLTDIHFAPTEIARNNLLAEGIRDHDIMVTGNTVIDALFRTLERQQVKAVRGIPGGKRKIIVTAHRRENFGAIHRGIFGAIREALEQRSDVEMLFPLHTNPHARDVAIESFRGMRNARLVEPIGYSEFCSELATSYLVLTDSGGIQEEAPALGLPVVVLRNDTERPEAVNAGVAVLGGTDPTQIKSLINRFLDDELFYRAYSKGISPYGDGLAAARISKRIVSFFSPEIPR